MKRRATFRVVNSRERADGARDFLWMGLILNVLCLMIMSLVILKRGNLDVVLPVVAFQVMCVFLCLGGVIMSGGFNSEARATRRILEECWDDYTEAEVAGLMLKSAERNLESLAQACVQFEQATDEGGRERARRRAADLKKRFSALHAQAQKIGLKVDPNWGHYFPK